MTIVKFIANASKKHAKVGSGKLPSKGNSPAAPPAPPVDEGKVEAKPVLEEKVEEEKVEDGRLERVVEEAPIQPKKAEDDVPPPKPAGKRKALLIGIQFYPVPEPAEPQDLPTSDAATRATPSLDASSYLTSITSRAKAKFMQMCSIGSPLASESALPSSSFSPAPPPPLVGTRKKSYAAAVSPRAGLSPAPSAWPALSSAAPVTSPITPVTPKTAAGGIMTSPTRVPLKPGRSAALQQQKSLTEKTAKKKREKEKKQEKKKEKSGQTKERSASSAWSFARKGCHRDVDEMEKMLVDLYGYSPSCITTMIDTPANVESDSHLLPTRENIITELQELVKDAEPGDRFFFFFAGHSTREPTEPMDEEDGMDELIVTYDNLLIKDDELREMLVKPLPPGVNLTAVFDSCHGADLLDLEHFRCNRVWVPWVNKGKRRKLSELNAVVRKTAAPLSPQRGSPMVQSPMSMSNPLSPIFDFERIRRVLIRRRRREVEADRTDRTDKTDKADRANEERNVGVRSGGPSRMASLGATSSMAMMRTTTTTIAHAWSSAVAATGSRVRALSLSRGKTNEGERGKKTKRLFGRHPRRRLSSEERFCTGWCRYQYEREGVDGKRHLPFVISLSAAKDGQQAWEDASGASMTQHLIVILRLREDPKPTMGTLLGQISHDLHTTYLDIHSRARDYRKKAREVNRLRLLKGKQIEDVVAVETNNFQDPQVSSLWPLDMKREIWDP